MAISILRARFALSVSLCAALAACGGTGTVLRSGDACGAGSSGQLIGQTRAAAESFAAQRSASGQPARVAGPDDAITADINPARLNIILDGTGIVRELACG